MFNKHHLDESYDAVLSRKLKHLRWKNMHIDLTLFLGLIGLSCLGLLILYSASNQNSALVEKQVAHLILAFSTMLIISRIPPHILKMLSPWIYTIGLLLLLCVPILGHSSQGAKRWIGIAPVLIQPSEIMKLGMPMMLAWLLENNTLPLNNRTLFLAGMAILIPSAIIIKQPDLGTGILVGLAGVLVLIVAGIHRKFIISTAILCLSCIPLAWHFMHQYQKQRILTFIDPARDPLGSGYNIIQSKIAVGSGGLFGKGWLAGTQSHLAFLPEHTTDFIFSVAAEEFGFIGALFIISCFVLIFLRCLHISLNSQNQYCQLLSASLSFTFIISVFINIGMVIGIVPVVGVPLSLISYGGSSMITLMIGFSIIMSIQTHKSLWST